MYLYLLKFKDGRRFKIGVTVNLQNRIETLGINHFDLTNSNAFEAPPSVVKALEKGLHSDFKPYQTDGTGLEQGYTEVFSIECWHQVLDEIARKQDKFPHLNIKEIQDITPKKSKKVQEAETKKVSLTAQQICLAELLNQKANSATLCIAGKKKYLGLGLVFRSANEFQGNSEIPQPQISTTANSGHLAVYYSAKDINITPSFIGILNPTVCSVLHIEDEEAAQKYILSGAEDVGIASDMRRMSKTKKGNTRYPKDKDKKPYAPRAYLIRELIEEISEHAQHVTFFKDKNSELCGLSYCTMSVIKQPIMPRTDNGNSRVWVRMQNGLRHIYYRLEDISSSDGKVSAYIEAKIRRLCGDKVSIASIEDFNFYSCDTSTFSLHFMPHEPCV